MAENNFSALVQLIVDKAQARTALQRELKELQKEAQLETDVKINLSDVKQARKEIAQANREQQEGTRENIKLRAQELANRRMLAKEIKANADLEDAQNRQALLQTKAKNKETIEGLKQERLLLQENRKLETERNKKSSTQKQIDVIQKMSNGGIKNDYSTQISVLTSNFQKLGLTEEEIQAKTSNVSTAFDALKKRLSEPFNESNYQEIIALNDKLQYELAQSSNEFTKLKASSNTISTSALASQQRIDSLANSMLSFRNNNSAMTREMKQSLDSMYNSLINGANLSDKEVDDLRHRFNMLKLEVRDSGKLGKSFGDSIKQGMASFSTWLPASTIIMKIVQAGKALIQNVEEMDDALTNISYTMDVTNTQLEKIGNSSLQTAKDLSTSASKVLDAVKTYANANETMNSIIDKAKPTIMMSNVSGMSTEQTVDIIQGTVEQFDLSDTEEQLMRISDVLQTVSANMPMDFAKGLKELSEGIQTSGQTAKQAGYDLESYVALLGTLISKTRQSGSELGRSLRTMMLRTTKASTSALASGEVTEDDLSNAEKALRRVGIEVRSDIDTFKDFDQIIAELYGKLDTLSDVDMSNLAYELAGIRQANVFKLMISSYGQYLDMAEKANNAGGITLANQEKYAESLRGKLTELGAIWEKIGDDAVSSSWLKGLTDVGIVVSTLIEKFGLLSTIGVGAGAFAFFKNLDHQKVLKIA